MSVKLRTYILYGTKITINNYDTERFEDKDDYIDYLYGIINKDESAYRLIYNEFENDYYFGYVIDKASTGNWDSEYLKTQTFSELISTITPEIKQSLEWLLLIHFNMRSSNCEIEHRILTVYC